MARKKTSKSRVSVKQMISGRLREVRQERFGEHGGPELARRLGLPARTWYNYETGVTVPAEVLLGFLEQTGTNPIWLFNGEGTKYGRGAERPLADLSPEDLIRRGLEKLERRPRAPAFAAAALDAGDSVGVALVPLADLALDPPATGLANGHVLAAPHWLRDPSRTVAVRLEDDAMHPILPAGSIVAVDRGVIDPDALRGKLVAADPGGLPVIRWLEVGEGHLILRPNRLNAEHPMIPIPRDGRLGRSPILGQVVWSWSRFGGP